MKPITVGLSPETVQKIIADAKSSNLSQPNDKSSGSKSKKKTPKRPSKNPVS